MLNITASYFFQSNDIFIGHTNIYIRCSKKKSIIFPFNFMQKLTQHSHRFVSGKFNISRHMTVMLTIIFYLVNMDQ